MYRVIVRRNGGKLAEAENVGPPNCPRWRKLTSRQSKLSTN